MRVRKEECRFMMRIVSFVMVVVVVVVSKRGGKGD